MSGDCPHLPYLAIYLISATILSSNSRGATHWKLNENEGVVRADGNLKDVLKSDPILSILTKAYLPKNSNSNSKKTVCGQCRGNNVAGHSIVSSVGPSALELFPSSTLTCGPSANETLYDHLEGIAHRTAHPPYAEPEVAMIFKKSEVEDVDLNEIERNLQRSFEESPNSVVVCNQIGNFWRIRGNTYHSIECFRKALATSPNNADVLLNLARVLFNLNYLQDAIYLTRRSLEMQPADHNCWLQHFTLGEILKANGELEEAAAHFRHALDLNPSFHPAEMHLLEIDGPLTTSTNAYTFLIIGLLVVIVLAVVYFMTLAGDSRGTKIPRMPLWSSDRKGITRKRPSS